MQTKQWGTALAIGLIILLVLTLMVLTGSQTVVLQEKMSASVRDSHIALAVAEAGLKEGENFIQTLTNTAAFTGSGGLYGQGAGPADVFAEANWEPGKFRNSSTLINGLRAQYFIELIGTMPVPANTGGVEIKNYNEQLPDSEITLFKIVSRSQGRSGFSEHIVVSYFGKKFDPSGKESPHEE